MFPFLTNANSLIGLIDQVTQILSPLFCLPSVIPIGNMLRPALIVLAFTDLVPIFI